MEGGVLGGSAFQSGSLVITNASVCETVSPSKMRLPVSISHSTTPKAQTSARLSAADPVACSGDMYEAVPRITPARVAFSVSVGEVERGEQFGFAMKPCEPLEIRGEAVWQDLDGDVALQPGVASPIHLAHSARTQQVEYLIRAESGARAQWHGAAL